MQTVWLLVIGVVLLFNGMPWLGIGSLLIALAFDRTCERLWCLVLAFCLFQHDWTLVALFCVFAAFVTVKFTSIE